MSYRFLVVDDEYYVRQRVKMCIPWSDYGFEYAGEAEDVPQALDFLQHERVELVVLDISMPGQNGLELIRTLREQGRQMQFIILSGFATFEYARRAMAYGVSHYLLKPIDAAELRATVAEIRDTLEANHRTMEAQQAFLRAKTAADRTLKQKFFHSIFSARTCDEDSKRLQAYGIRPDQRYELLVLDAHPSVLRGHGFEQQTSIRLAAHNTAAETAMAQGCVCTCTDERGRLVLLFPCAPGRPAAQALISLLSHALLSSAGIQCTAAYSDCFAGQPEALSGAYRSAMRFFMFRCIYGNDADMNCAGMLTKHTLELLQKDQNALSLALLGGESQQLPPLLSSWFSVVRREQLALSALEAQLSALLSVAMTYSAEHARTSPQEEVVYSASSLLDAGYDLEQLEEHLLQLFLSLADEAENENRTLIRKAVDQAADLMRSEYARPDMGLRYLAARLVISPAYLSRNFKLIYGMTLMQYLTQLRMERARELLMTPGMTVAQAAELVGYQDAFYFSKRFKNHFGVSPSRMEGGS